MKTSVNGRKERLEIISNFMKSNNHLTEYELIEAYTQMIISEKKEKNFRNINETSKKYRRIVVESRERAITHISLYNHVNDIKCKLGFFYIIACESFPGYYKLGYSKDAEHRLNTYQTYSPLRDYYLEKYLAVVDAPLAEKAAMDYLGDRLSNEWFKSNDIQHDFLNMAAYIAAYTKVENRYAVK